MNYSFKVLWKSSGGSWICLGNQWVKTLHHHDHISLELWTRIILPSLQSKWCNLSLEVSCKSKSLILWSNTHTPALIHDVLPTRTKPWTIVISWFQKERQQRAQKKKSALSELPTQELLVCGACGRKEVCCRSVHQRYVSVSGLLFSYQTCSLRQTQDAQLMAAVSAFVQLLFACLCLSFLRIANLMALLRLLIIVLLRKRYDISLN